MRCGSTPGTGGGFVAAPFFRFEASPPRKNMAKPFTASPNVLMMPPIASFTKSMSPPRIVWRCLPLVFFGVGGSACAVTLG